MKGWLPVVMPSWLLDVNPWPKPEDSSSTRMTKMCSSFRTNSSYDRLRLVDERPLVNGVRIGLPGERGGLSARRLGKSVQRRAVEDHLAQKISDQVNYG